MTNRERIDSAMMKAYNNERADFVRSMNNIMVHMNDENAYMKWITVVPDGADEEHFTTIPVDSDSSVAITKLVKLIEAESKRDDSIDMWFPYIKADIGINAKVYE